MPGEQTSCSRVPREAGDSYALNNLFGILLGDFLTVGVQENFLFRFLSAGLFFLILGKGEEQGGEKEKKRKKKNKPTTTC